MRGHEFPSSIANECIILIEHGFSPLRVLEGLVYGDRFKARLFKLSDKVELLDWFMNIMLRSSDNASGLRWRLKRVGLEDVGWVG